MVNTKARHLEILAAAASLLEQVGGVEYIDSLTVDERLPILRQMYKALEDQTGCHYDTAKRNVAKALRRARYGVMQAQWGGRREGAGNPDWQKKKASKTDE